MSRIVLCFVLVAAVAAGSAPRVPLRGNYDGLQAFVVNFMTAYEGKLFNSSSVCFGPVACSKMDADLVAMMKSLTFGKIEDFSLYMQTFVSDVQGAMYGCQMKDIDTSFKNNKKVHGWDFFMGNVFWRAMDIITAFGKSFADLVKGNVADCGLQLGTITNYVNPPNLNGTKLHYEAINLAQFVEGTLAGLELTPGSGDKCYNELIALSVNITQTQSDFSQLVSGNIAAVFSVIADLQKLLSAVKQDSADCNLPALGEVFLSLLTPDGIADVGNNLYNNMGQIAEATKAYKDCEGNMYQCGVSTGEIFRLVMGWGI